MCALERVAVLAQVLVVAEGVFRERRVHRCLTLALAPTLTIHYAGCPGKNCRSGKQRLGARRPARATSIATLGRLWVAERAHVAVPRLQRGCLTCLCARHIGWLALRERRVRVDGVRADELICVLLLFLVRVVYLCRLKDGHVLAAPAFLAPAVLSPMLAEAAAAALLAPGAAETAVLAEAGAAAFLAQWY